MTYLFCGSDLEAFTLVGSWTTTTDNKKFDPNFQRSAMRGPNNSSGLAYTTEFAAQDELWVHFSEVTVTASGSNFPWVVFYDNTNTALFRFFRFVENGPVVPQYWNGSTWVTISGIEFDIRTDVRVDIHVKGGVGGLVELYLNELPYASAMADMSLVTGITRVAFCSCSSTSTSGNRCQFSEIIVSDVSTLWHRVLTRWPTGNGAHTDFTGDYTSVDEIGFSDADFISGATAGDDETFVSGARSNELSVPKAIALTMRARRGPTGPQSMQGLLRINGTDYASSNITLDTSFGATCTVWESNPATSGDWDKSTVENIALEYGVKAVA